MASGFAHTLSSTCGYENTGLIGSTSVVQLYRGISEISPTEGFAVILVGRAITIARARTSACLSLLICKSEPKPNG
ncbi:hypothetical protein LIPSTDRAFT_296109 [Lipomyces starkeyi NRRL Y-11557]|uniref:Uncharacterized protein n=1 Tax=Lipomyces starkeyi NRRL Y-11557 TaxID=675824 RepID=A0A1E3Q406_LIPST|nr:hypothetical protein LIPSTDRAFT_296109 [Lipomyces starkeyi NRRL Y-11557]